MSKGSGGSGGGGRSGRSGGGDAGQPGEVVQLSAAQIGTAQGKVASITANILEREWGLSSNPYHEKSLEFLRDQAGRKTPMTEKQANWMRKLTADAAKSKNATANAKVYLSEKVLKRIGL